MNSEPLSAASFLQPPETQFFPGVTSDVSFNCTGSEGRSEASCTLFQSPSPENGYTAIVDFDDDVAVGAADYSATLSFHSSGCVEGGSAGGSAGAGGADGGGGSSGASDQGGSAGSNDTNHGHLLLSTSELDFDGICTVDAQAFTITNDGKGPVTWGSSVDDPEYYELSPTGSTLEPGNAIDVTVIPLEITLGTSQPLTRLEITSDVPEQQNLTLPVRRFIEGYAPASDIDMGDVPVLTEATTTVPEPDVLGPISFTGASGYFTWSTLASFAREISFLPLMPGRQTADVVFLTWWDPCPIGSSGVFHVTANGAFRQCDGANDGIDCGFDSYCETGVCTLEVSVDPPTSFGGGATLYEWQFQSRSTDPFNTYQAFIDWGDGVQDASYFDGTGPGGLRFAGLHEYAASGSFSGTFTLTDLLVGTTKSFPFTAVLP